jgi:glycerophosphoryl diester phosphodiesterase
MSSTDSTAGQAPALHGKREPLSDWGMVRLVAHRCGGWLAPENSLAGLLAAAAAGFHAVEFDVMLSGDGTPWLIHDETLERTSDQRGAVAHTPDRVLAGVRVGRERRGLCSLEPMPQLTPALQLCGELGLLPNIEIKPATGYEEATGEVVAAAVAQWMATTGAKLRSSPLLSSFSTTALAAAAKTAPKLARALLVEAIPADWQQQMAALGAAALHCDAAQLTPEALAAVRAAGVPLRCYTVNDPARAADLFKCGVGALFTDAVEAMAAARLAR